MKTHFERCPVPVKPSKVFTGHKETVAWSWRKYVIVRCFRSPKTPKSGFIYYVIFPDGKVSAVTNKLLDPTFKTSIYRWNLPLAKLCVLKDVQANMPVAVENMHEDWDYNE
jgi:hypothetical protein